MNHSIPIKTPGILSSYKQTFPYLSQNATISVPDEEEAHYFAYPFHDELQKKSYASEKTVAYHIMTSHGHLENSL
mgnify:CR=1 FL=1